jgi:hypothetical protein
VNTESVYKESVIEGLLELASLIVSNVKVIFDPSCVVIDCGNTLIPGPFGSSFGTKNSKQINILIEKLDTS